MADAPRSLLALIGNTPLIDLPNLGRELPHGVRLSLKAEWANPGGSVKDRAAAAIVEAALASGALRAGGTLLDASSGNTGIAYAMLGAAMGFRVALCVPASANAERQRTLRIYGAEVILTDAGEGSDGAIVEARRRVAAAPTRYFYADQYNNPANWQAHLRSTGPELVAQTGGGLTHFVVGLGTTGTCVGVGRYLRQHLPAARVVAVQPSGPFHGLEGLKHLETAIVPGIYDASVPHAQVGCETEAAYAMARRVARQEGLIVGISAGAALHVAWELARGLPEGAPAHVVALAPDSGARYLSEHFWQES
ncbi:MAG TPA: cysteine synthase family protein [Myxococcota bacterium]|nr:cysteine synthase family protein [Myxococcota bacterium]